MDEAAATLQKSVPHWLGTSPSAWKGGEASSKNQVWLECRSHPQLKKLGISELLQPLLDLFGSLEKGNKDDVDAASSSPFHNYWRSTSF